MDEQLIRYTYNLFICYLSENVLFMLKDEQLKTGANNFTDKVPRVCFASEMENRNRQRVRKAYTGMVLLGEGQITRCLWVSH